MSPIIDLPIFLHSPKIQKAGLYEFLGTLSVSDIEITEIIPDNIWRVKVNFKYKREWKIFCKAFWGEKYFNEHINRKKS